MVIRGTCSSHRISVIPLPSLFFYHPGKDEETIGLPVKLVGDLGVQDQGYRIEVLTSESTASSSNYSLPAEQVFRKGVAKDTAWVTLKKTPDLDTRK